MITVWCCWFLFEDNRVDFLGGGAREAHQTQELHTAEGLSLGRSSTSRRSFWKAKSGKGVSTEPPRI